MPGHHLRDSDEETLRQDQNFKRSSGALQNSTHQMVIVRPILTWQRFPVTFSLLLIYHSQLWKSTGLRLGVNAPKESLNLWDSRKTGDISAEFKFKFKIFQIIHVFLIFDSKTSSFWNMEGEKGGGCKRQYEPFKILPAQATVSISANFLPGFFTYTYIFNFLVVFFF